MVNLPARCAYSGCSQTEKYKVESQHWYAGLLSALLVLFGVFIYFTLERFLERSLRETLAKEAQTIGETFIREVDRTGDAYVVEEIDEHFAPRITGRFLRVTRPDGTVLYESSPPENGAFDPSEVSRARLDGREQWRKEHLPNGQELLIHGSFFADGRGNKHMVEAGTADVEVERVPMRSALLSRLSALSSRLLLERRT